MVRLKAKEVNDEQAKNSKTYCYACLASRILTASSDDPRMIT